jgi:hypothetical protein
MNERMNVNKFEQKTNKGWMKDDKWTMINERW